MFDTILFGHFGDPQANQDALRYSAITTLLGFVHFTFCIIFAIMHVYPMVIYNIIVVIGYFILSKSLSNIKVFTKIFFVYIFEINLHSALATLFVGWNYAFMYYLITLIPVSFYISFSVKAFKRKLKYAFITAAITFVTFFAIRIITYVINPLYADIPKVYEIVFSTINYIIAFGATFVFSSLFAVEVNSMQLMMEAEQEKLEDKASYDSLTHFLNRRAMDERLTNAHRNAIINNVTYSLIMCDIDHFKKFNDNYGHDCGDFVLQTISKIISSQIRSKDSACRWGGEEFLLLIADNSDTAAEVAERIRSAIDNYEFYYEGKTLHVTITLGVAGYYSSSKIKTLIEIADKRLYKGKESGRNQVICN